MASFKQDVTLRHQANLGEDVQDVRFEAGATVEVLQEWEKHWLVKDGEGRVFNVPKDAIEA